MIKPYQLNTEEQKEILDALCHLLMKIKFSKNPKSHDFENILNFLEKHSYMQNEMLDLIVAVLNGEQLLTKVENHKNLTPETIALVTTISNKIDDHVYSETPIAQIREASNMPNNRFGFFAKAQSSQQQNLHLSHPSADLSSHSSSNTSITFGGNLSPSPYGYL